MKRIKRFISSLMVVSLATGILNFQLVEAVDTKSNAARFVMTSIVEKKSNTTDVKNWIINEISPKDIKNKNYSAQTSMVAVDFKLMYDNKENIVEYLKSSIKQGKTVFIRSKGISANENVISSVLGFKQLTTIEATEGTALDERKYTMGFIVYLDESGTFQTVRQLLDPRKATLKKEIKKIKKTKLDKKAQKEHLKKFQDSIKDMPSVYQISLEYKAATSYFEAKRYSYRKGQNGSVSEKEFSPQKISLSKFHYHKTLDTVAYYQPGEGELQGHVTRDLYAYRIAPASTTLVADPLPAATKETTVWAIECILSTSPSFDDNTVVTDDSTIKFENYPKSINSFKQTIMDYAPKNSTSGSLALTWSFGATASKEGPEANGGVSFVQEMKDLVIVAGRPIRGLNKSTNSVEWKYDYKQGIFWDTFPNDISKYTSEVAAGVLVKNEGTNKIGIRVNTTSSFLDGDGPFTWTPIDFNKYIAPGFSWWLPVR